MTMDDFVEMSTCNLAKMIHNKWLKKLGSKMTCLYDTIVVNLIHVFTSHG